MRTSRTELAGVSEIRQAVGDESAVQTFVKGPTREALKRVWGVLLEAGPSGKATQVVEKLAERVRAGKMEGLAEEQARLVNK